MGVKIGGHIEKVNGKGLSYGEFAERYLAKNRPVVLTGLMDHWRACRDWVTADGHPNLLFFATHFGRSKVQVADCGTREFTDQKRVEMSVSEFIGQWLNDSSKECSNDSTQKHSSNSVLYLKDWHFVKEYPDYIAYTTPLFCLDDWLNLYLDSYKMHEDQGAEQENDEISCSDYRFVYMGAKGSWTPLHADVFRSYSWSANVCGQKQWLFLPPSQCHLVFDRNMKSCVYDIFDNVNETKFPGFEKAIWLECTQERNEIIFVPSGWYHQVHNMEDTISINHNWFNGYNLSWVWDLLVSDYDEAKEYIEDIKDICDDFEGLCQRNLAANTGMNFRDFFIFIARFSFANLVQLCNIHNDDENHIRRSFPVAPHLVSNLISMRRIASKMKSQGLKGNQGFFLDLKELLDAPRFHKLCMDLGMTYGLIHEQHNWSCGSKNTLMDKFRSSDIVKSCSSYQAFSPENLIQIVDNYIQKLNGICSEENDLSSKLDNALLVADS